MSATASAWLRALGLLAPVAASGSTAPPSNGHRIGDTDTPTVAGVAQPVSYPATS